MPGLAGHGLRIVIAGGGTLGHVLPGLAVAEAISARVPSALIVFAGHRAELESPHVAAAGYAHRAFRAQPLPRGWRGCWTFVRENLIGYLQARRWLKDTRPHVVLATGGYACVPVARACLAEGLPLVLLELNALPGRASRWLARRATAVCVASPAAAAELRTPRWWLTGTPLRTAFVDCLRQQTPAPWTLPGEAAYAKHEGLSPELGPIMASDRQRQPTLIVLGGGRGAEELNQCVPSALALSAAYVPASVTSGAAESPWQSAVAQQRWQVIHVAGPGRARSTAARYAALGINAQVLDFIHQPADLLSRASVAVCRCGASTLAELAACGVPAVLVPYRAARDDHQMANAREVARAGGGVLVDAPQPQAIAAALGQLADEHRRRRMARAMRRLATPEAAHRIAALLLRVAGWA